MDVTPYWFDSGSFPRCPKLSGDLDVDVAIVGGGMTGLTAAYWLKRAGKTVALIERGRIGGLDSSSTTAHLTSVTDLRLQEIAKTFGKDAARAVWDAHGAAIDQIVRAIEQENIACDFHWVPGYLHAALGQDNDKQRKQLKREAEVAADLKIPAEYSDAIPLMNVAGVRFPHQALFHPRKYLAALARAVSGDGSQVCDQTAVDEIEEKPLGLKCGQHRVRCRKVIIATHTPLTGTTPLLPALLFQTKLYLYSTYAIGARLPAGTLPEASFWDTADPYNYLRVDRRRDHDYAIYGGEDHKTGQVSDTEAPFGRLEARLKAIHPAAQVDHRWSGQVIETNDGLPFIGETGDRQFAATGYSGNGMTYGTLAGLMAADWVLRRRNPWADLFDPHRKKLHGGTWTYLKENIDYPYYLVRDWIGGAEAKTLAAVPRGEGKILHLGGKKVAAHRDAAGKVTLCSPVCTHLQCIVHWNTAEKTWDCPCHGSRFKPTGEVISGPAEEPLAPVKAD